jgi:hypothetical protein
MAKDMKLGAYPRHGVQELTTSFVRTGNRSSIEDAEGGTMADQDVNVPGNLRSRAFSDPLQNSDQTRH